MEPLNAITRTERASSRHTPLRRGVRLVPSRGLEIGAILVIGVAAAIRVALIVQGWPPLNSDEATNGLMALHIVSRGELPIFVYGQAYVGAIEAYLAATLFWLFGPSDVALRAGAVTLYALFLGALYLLARLLYDRTVALVSIAVLSLGSPEMLSRQLEASGGYMEMLVCATIAFVLACWLVLSSPSARSRARLAAYLGVGLAWGLGIWSHPIVLALLPPSAILLLVARRDELRTRAPLFLLAGLVGGLLPVILNDLSTFPHHTTIGTLFGLYGAGGTGATTVRAGLDRRLGGGLLVGFPLFTGGWQICNLAAPQPWPLPSHPGPHTVLCTEVHGAWTGGFVATWAIAVAGTLAALRRRPLAGRANGARRTEQARAACRLAVLSAAGLTILLYVLSAGPAIAPRPSARYLVDLWIAVPCLVAVLLSPCSLTRRMPLLRSAKIALVGGLLVVMALDTVDAFGQIPYMQWQTWEQHALISHLERLGATRIYTDYWTCYRTIYQSRERILCAVLDEHLRPGEDRYPAYRTAVQRDPNASYVFPLHTPYALAISRYLAHARRRYRRYELNYYVVYVPA
ncbi:MAG TPA: glycosyltransferase family 39 protein [Chloroflexota bacterium]|nr:glycosyltransferase family 39 protein [Chloroflexota bacterium]